MSHTPPSFRLRSAALAALLLAGASAWAGVAPSKAQSSAWNTLRTPIDSRHQTALQFCDRSHWAQPWRAYLETRPGSVLRQAAGMNFNVSPAEAPALAQLLAAKGFRRARVEIGWSEMSYENPAQVRDPGRWTPVLGALRSHGIRPLILLNANHGSPGPVKRFGATIVAPAAAGDRNVLLDAASAGQVVPGRTGFDIGDKGAAILITSVDDEGRAELSAPLPADTSPGEYPATTLRFAPFARPLTASGEPNPHFEATLDGWLTYVRAVVQGARAILGTDQFDVEVWNELSFASEFLDAGSYYDPLPPELAGSGDTTRAILERTVALLRNPANGVSKVGIGDGFANQTPFPSGATSPAGLTALDKHPYAGPRQFATGSQAALPCQPVNALGQREGTRSGDRWVDSFTPAYTSYFPEYYLNAIQTEHLIRDMSPITTYVSGVPHGRATHPPGAPAPTLWVTETGMDPGGLGLSEADRQHMQAKSALRFLVSYVNKGAAAVHFYAAGGPNWGLVAPSFFASIPTGANLSAGGETVDAIGRLMGTVGTATPSTKRSLSLLEVSDQHNRRQFDGDGTAAHPPLFNREVVAFLPFQAANSRFVIPTYVMTRNVAQLYRPDAPASDVTRYDLPPETYRLKIGGLAALTARVSAYDPLADRSTPARIVARGGGAVTVELELTDSPRLLVITNG